MNPPTGSAHHLFIVTLGRLTMAFDRTWQPWQETFAELEPFQSATTAVPSLTITWTRPPFHVPVAFRTRRISFSFDDLEHPRQVWVQSPHPTPPVVALKILCACLLPRCGGLFLHGALLIRGERGVLLTGTSESGKSSLAALWMQRSGLCGSDEAVIVYPAGHRWLAYPTPFWGALPPRFSSAPQECEVSAHVSLIHHGFPALMKCVLAGDDLAKRHSVRNAAEFLRARPPSFLPRERDIMNRMQLLETLITC